MWKLFNKKDESSASAKASTSASLLRHSGYGGREATADKTALPVSVNRAPKSGAQAYGILLKPIVSEKAAHGAAGDTYSFVVNKISNKIEIAKAFQALYQVKPLSVRVMITAGKQKRRGRIMGIQPGHKKAVVRVPAGSKISVFASV